MDYWDTIFSFGQITPEYIDSMDFFEYEEMISAKEIWREKYQRPINARLVKYENE